MRRFVPILVEEPLRWGVRRMRQEWRVIDKERFLVGGRGVNEVIDWLEALPADNQAVIAMPSAAPLPSKKSFSRTRRPVGAGTVTEITE